MTTRMAEEEPATSRPRSARRGRTRGPCRCRSTARHGPCASWGGVRGPYRASRRAGTRGGRLWVGAGSGENESVLAGLCSLSGYCFPADALAGSAARTSRGVSLDSVSDGWLCLHCGGGSLLPTSLTGGAASSNGWLLLPTFLKCRWLLPCSMDFEGSARMPSVGLGLDL
jgi:hypothetical protein